MAVVMEFPHLPSRQRRAALLGQFGEDVMAIMDIPAEDLVALVEGDSSAYLILYVAHRKLEEKLCQMSNVMRGRGA